MINQRRTSSFAPAAGRRFGFQNPGASFNTPDMGLNIPMPMGNQKPSPLSFQPPPSAPIAPQAAPEEDFMKQYNDVIGNRPNRLAYQQSVEEGAPQIDRGKWAKLGAIVAAGATGFGQNDANAGYRLGMSSYLEPQRKSDERWKEKNEGLGKLATMEDSDVAARINALEAKRDEAWRAKDAGLRERSTKIAESAEGRASESDKVQARLVDAQISNMAMDKMVPVEMDDGNTYMYDKGTRTKFLVGKTGQTHQEEFDNAKRTFSMQEGIKGYYQRQKDERDAASSLANVKYAADAGVEKANITSKAKIDVAISRLKEAAAKMKPDDVGKNILLDMAEAIGNGELPDDAATYLKFDSNGVPTADAGFTGDSQTASAVSRFIAQSIGKSRNGGTTAPSVPGSQAGANQASIAAKTVKVIGPDGMPTMETPEDAKALVESGEGIRYAEEPPTTPAVKKSMGERIRSTLGLREPPPVTNPQPVVPSGRVTQPGFGQGYKLQGTPIPAGVRSLPPTKPAERIAATAPVQQQAPPQANPLHFMNADEIAAKQAQQPPQSQPNPITLAPQAQPTPNPLPLAGGSDDRLYNVLSKVKQTTGLTIKPGPNGNMVVLDNRGKPVPMTPVLAQKLNSISAPIGLAWNGSNFQPAQ